MEKTIVGLVEKVGIKGENIDARIDTGAKYSSITVDLAKRFELGPVIRTVIIRSSNGKEIRPVVKFDVEIKGKVLNAEFNITDRSHMRFPILVGRNILTQGFLIDPGEEE